MQKAIITVVGSFAVGMTLRTKRMPIFGETLLGSEFDMGPGGKGSNQAVGAARLGHQVCFAGIIGNDKLGEIAIELYKNEGVNAQYLHKTSQHATGVGFIILNQAGENGIILDMGANKLMDAQFVDTVEAQIAKSNIVMSVLEIPIQAAARAMTLGRKHGIPTLLNPAPAAILDDSILQNVDFLTPNETELRILMKLPPNDPTPSLILAKKLQARGAKTVIVTLGEQGAVIVTKDMIRETPGISVSVVDSTGAGDAFNAGLAVALAEGKSVIEAVKFANCAGAIACTKLGVIPALAYRNQIEDLYNQHYR